MIDTNEAIPKVKEEPTASTEIAAGERFGFGDNWLSFLDVLDEESVAKAEAALARLLHVTSLQGKLFLDVGSGSGLSSLSAHRLGARVVSFDYDPSSVRATTELRRRFGVEDDSWKIVQGSVLDPAFMKQLPAADVVYSWGVLHHTGDMWSALANVCLPLKADGTLAVALYNDQGTRSTLWKKIKRLYCSGIVGKTVVVAVAVPYFVVTGFGKDVLRGRNPLSRYLHKVGRGMSVFHDWFDWLGGYPFEVASPEAVVSFYRERGLLLDNIITVGGASGNNEFVFVRRGA